MAVSVQFGSTLAANVTVVSDTEITATTPAHAAGVVDVTVTTAGGSATLDDAFTYEAPEPDPEVELTIPATIAVTVGDQEEYTTTLVNTGGDVEEAIEEIRLHSDDGPLTAGDVTYETFDGGTWTEVTWTEEDGDLLFTELYPIPAGLDADSNVRITVNRDVGDLSGTSRITNNADDTELASATYDFTVTP